MKKFTFNFGTRFFNLLTIVGALLFSIGIWAQPTVNVPAGCNVVVAGNGGNTSTGIVGSGGIVTMPDPGGGVFSINVPSGYSITGWTLYGDLSINSGNIGTHGSADQSVGSGITSVDIISYNKTYRNSESNSPSLARSKGRVNIDYIDNINSCPGVITFDVYKTYTDDPEPPEIVGPECWIPDSLFTYSVDQIASDNLNDAIGVDSYYWSIVDKDNNLVTNFYTSADKSSITVKAPNPLNSPYTIQACFGRANNWDNDAGGTPTVCVTKTIGADPIQPTLTYSFSPSSCLPVSATNFTASVNAPVQNYTYTWASNNSNWTLSDPATGSNMTFSTIGTGQGSILLTVEGCKPMQFQYDIGRSLEEPITSITGTTTCLDAGADYTFEITNASQLDITWILPTGWTINNTPPTNGNHSIISLHVPSTATPGSYTLEAWSCDNNTLISKTIYIRPESPVISTPASASLCIDKGDNTPIPFTVTPAGTYEWQIPTGWVISSATDNTESITVTPDGTHTGTVTAIGTSDNGNCTSTSNAVWTVNFTPIQPSGIESVSCWNFGTGAPVDITVSNAPDPFYGTYTISSSPAGLFSSYDVDSNTGEITLDILADAPAGTYTLTITHVANGNCSTASNTNIPINYVPKGNLPVAPILTTDNSYASYGFDGFKLDNILPIVAVEWFVNDVSQGSPTTNNLSFYVDQSSYTPPYSVCAQFTVNGCTSRVCMEVTGHQSLIRNDGSGMFSSSSKGIMTNNINVFPNPNNGTFRVSILAFKNTAEMQLHDMNGKLVNTYNLEQGENTIKEQLPTGNYMLLFTVDGKTSAQKLLIKK